MDNNKNYQFKPEDFQLVQTDKKIHDTKFDTKATTFARDAVRRFAKNKSSVVAAWLLAILLLLSVFVPIFSVFDVDSVHNSEALLPPKLFEPEEGSWDTFWNGTQLYESRPYDMETGLPVGDYNPNAILVLEECDIVYQNKADSNAGGGIFIFAASYTKETAEKKKSNTPYLELYDAVDFTADGGYKLSFTLTDPAELAAAGDFVLDNIKDATANVTDMAGTSYRVFIQYGDGEELVLKDWCNDWGTVELDISQAIADAGLTELTGAKIRFELEFVENALAYIAIEELILSSTIEDEELQTLLSAMSMAKETETIDGVEQEVPQGNAKVLIAKQDDGTFPAGYWRSNGNKTVYHAYKANCNFVYDLYAATYGVMTTNDVTTTSMQTYIENGWCSYDYEVGPESFQILDEDRCPIISVDAQTPLTVGDKTVYQLTCTVLKYKVMGYTSMPKSLLGTTRDGWDLITLSFKSLRTSFFLAILVSAVCLSFGLVWGSIAGYFGGNVDIIMQRFTDILGGVPWIVMMTLAIIMFGNNLKTYAVALCLTSWMGTAGRTRTQFYRYKGREYILASRTLGASDFRLIFRHILPNALGTIVTGAVLFIPSIISYEATLSYLGLGLQGTKGFGTVLNDGQQYFQTKPMLIMFPTIIIAIIMISFNLFGNGLRDALNPSLKGSD